MSDTGKNIAACIVVVLLFAASLFLTGKVHEGNMNHAHATQYYTASCVTTWLCAVASLILLGVHMSDKI